MCHKIVFFFIFSKHLEKQNPFLAHKTGVQIQVVSQI